jgi:hypothetical protein
MHAGPLDLIAIDQSLAGGKDDQGAPIAGHGNFRDAG